MTSEYHREPLQIAVVRRDDHISILREQNNSRIDDVGEARSAQQLTSRPAESLVQRPDVNTRQRLREPSLTWSSTPDLPKDAAMSPRDVAFDLRGLQSDPHRALVPFERNERSAVEHDTHAD